MAGLVGLTGLYLHYNAISGSIPKEISNLTKLSDLYLNVNNLSGHIREEIGGMVNLQGKLYFFMNLSFSSTTVLQLGYNQMTRSIPTQLGLLKNLKALSLQYNHLTGAIPASLGDLAQLRLMDLSFNHLFGSIPEKLSQSSRLFVLELQNNSLSGIVPPEGFKFGNNSDLCGDGFPSLRQCTAADIVNHNSTEPYASPSSAFTLEDIPLSANISSDCTVNLCRKSYKSPLATVFLGAVIVIVFGTTLGLFTWYRRKKKINSSGLLQGFDSKIIHDHSNELSQKRASPLASLEYSNGWDPLADGRWGVGFSKEVSQSFRFNFEEVECAAQYFSEVNLICKGSFSAIYKGRLRDGTMVAVKSICKTSCKSEEAEFLNGLKILTTLQHPNVVRLKGFCFSRARGECFLVYDFISNGKLSQYLDAKSQDDGWFLDWPTRVSIIKGIAKGIEFLHSTKVIKPSLVHQNITADKIFLDHNFTPFLSCCSLHRLLADDIVFSTVKTTAAMGYLAPEYTRTGGLTEKSDVYAFGIVVLQILLGKQRAMHLKPSGKDDGIEDRIDGKLEGNFSREEAEKLAEIASLCTSEIPNQRPAMEDVLEELISLSRR
ncbi:putative LRR receptor-like serine/threonine-protein kinase [Platanthera guangdongensis]|uniref:LRR receptor-like serine/threonine-protein kinase n=1 Tax=Platanthera guangdongensis TaxID=2320717 RepID=A0ABR2MJ93_9ASPA